MIPAVKYKVSTSNSGVSPRQSQERHWKPYGNSPNRACLYIASLLFAAQFYEMPGHRHRINRVINVQVNTLFTETFPTMVNLELPNFHKWSRLIVARDTFTMIPPVYFALFAKFSQMCQVDCCWRLGCPRKLFFSGNGGPRESRQSSGPGWSSSCCGGGEDDCQRAEGGPVHQ